MAALVRPPQGKFVLGVCAGISRYTGIDPVLVRVGFTLLGLTSAGLGVLLYLAAWLLMRPSSGGPSYAEQWTGRGYDGDTVLALLGAGFAIGAMLSLPGLDLSTVGTVTLFVIVMLTAHARGVDLREVARTLPAKLRKRNAPPPPPSPSAVTEPFAPHGPYETRPTQPYGLRDPDPPS